MASISSGIDPKWVRRQVSQYKRVFPRYKLYAKTLCNILDQAAIRYAPLAIVQSRPKGVESFAGKIMRKKANDPVREYTDLCGARVITHMPGEVRAISKFIEEHFDVDWDNTYDVSQRLKPTEFGYRSIHYIVQLSPNVFPTKDINVKIPDKLFPDNYPNGHPMKAEIQVRTILEHAWADFSHDRSYKGAFKIPDKWQRELATQAAILEEADQEFSKINNGLKTYASTYGAYMANDQVEEEIERLETVLKYDHNNAKLAHRIGKLAITLGNWSKAIEIMSKYVGSGYQPIQRDLGVALCKRNRQNSRGYKKGQRYLEEACSLPDGDADALASLAGTWRGVDDDKARELYCRAFEIDPTDPYALGNYLQYEIVYARDTSLVSCMSPMIKQAVQRCRDQADVGMNIPWAFYSMGKFYLLLGKSYDSLSAHAKAIQLSEDYWMVDTSLSSLDSLAVVVDKLPGYESVRRLLVVGKAVIASRKAKEVAEEARKTEDAKERAKKVKEAKEKEKIAKEAIEEVKKLALPGCDYIPGQVVIVAGGCDASIEKKMKRYQELLIKIFASFKGTVIAGGTTAGISGLVGDVQDKYPTSIDTISYVPRMAPANTTIDQRYKEIRYTEGDDFSALEAIQNWIDLISSGIDPSQVKLIGINGGKIAAAEYRIALAIGASVAVVEESGQEAGKLFLDPDWSASKALMHLPADAMTLRTFIGKGDQKLKPHETREIVARAIHENYRETQLSGKINSDPSMAEWDNLQENLKESNRQQADDIAEKLKQINYAVRKTSAKDIKPVKFTKQEIETMAEMEHARWMVERFLDGWVWAEERDIVNKKSPYLVPWLQLPDEIKEWDRQTVRKIPELLARVGLEIYRTK